MALDRTQNYRVTTHIRLGPQSIEDNNESHRPQFIAMNLVQKVGHSTHGPINWWTLLFNKMLLAKWHHKRSPPDPMNNACPIILSALDPLTTITHTFQAGPKGLCCALPSREP